MMLSRLVLRQSKRRLLPATSAISFQSARALSPRAHQQHLSPAWECRRLISSTQIQYAEGKGKGKGKKKTKKEKTKAQKEGENDEDEVFMPDIKFREIDASGKKPMLQANIPEQEESRLPLSEPEEKEKIQQQPVAAKAEERSVKKIAPETPITTKPAELASSSVENEGVMKVKEPTVEKRIEKPKPVEDWSSSEALQAIPLHGFYRCELANRVIIYDRELLMGLLSRYA